MKQYEYVVYILECSDTSLYIGMTSNVEKRLYEHNSGVHPNAYTYNKRPVEIVYTATLTDVYEAIAWERKLKRWSNAKKKALIEHDWGKISKEAECKNDTHSKNISR